MDNYINRQTLILLLEKQFSNEISKFPNYVVKELTSLLAFSIITVDDDADLASFELAILHICRQQGLMSYSALNDQQRLCVDEFAIQIISQQEHIVFTIKKYMDTLRIEDAHENTIETRKMSLYKKLWNGFTFGFVSITTKLNKVINRMVSLKTGGKHD